MQRRNFLIAALSLAMVLGHFEDDTEVIIFFLSKTTVSHYRPDFKQKKENIHRVFKILCYSAAWLFWEGESTSANTPSLRADVFSGPW